MRKGLQYTMKISIIAAVLLGITSTSSAQLHTGTDYATGQPVNFLRTWDAQAPESDPNNLMARSLKDVKMATQYLDGLGRPLQTVIKQGSLVTGSAPTDMVSSAEYDAYGRTQYQWLPYADPAAGNGTFKTTPFSAQSTFYNDPNGVLKAQGENYYYGKTIFEASPLNRVNKTLAPGINWAGAARGVEQQYRVNTTTDDVKMWLVTDVAGNFGNYTLNTSINTNGSYNPGELFKTISIDEHGKQVEQFSDKQGKIILKKVQLTATADDGTGSNYIGWMCTYYIYDDLDRLRCVIQPEGIKSMATSGNWQLTSTMLSEQCFRYEYDNRDRVIMKQVPGAATIYMVYDQRDRLTMMQDGNTRTQGKWMVTLYDNLNRPVQTGLWTDANTLSYHAAQSAASSNYYYPFDANTIPASGWDKQTATHYDSYTGLPNTLSATFNSMWNSYFATASNTSYPYPQSLTTTTNTTGLATWTETKVLDGGNTFMTAVMLYDDKGRVIQVQSTNATGGVDVATTQYNWAGQPLTVVQKSEKGGSTNPQTHVVVTKMDYDDLGRVADIKKTVNSTVNGTAVNKPEQLIVQNQYDALGKLKKKTLAPAYNSNAGLETENFDYNIRGWLLGMNRDYAKDVIPPSGGGGAYFGFDLGYDKTANGLINNQSYNAAQYNGNISGMVWKSKGDGEKRKYDFAYDGANRLLKADFTQYDGSAFSISSTFNFNVKMGDGSDVNSAYDYNGNIKRMQQWGLKVNNSTQIDDLAYTYQTGTNKLAKVTDGITTTDNGKLGDFKDGTNTGDDYSYDVNGNMNLDNNKAISSITYNYLNLPSVIAVSGKGTITYTYDAGGNKLQKQTVDNSTSGKTITTTTRYINGLVYESKTTSPTDANNPDYTDVLQFLPQEEGRIRFIPATGSTAAAFQYDYMLKDHLGNVRTVLTEEQRQDIYPAATLEPSLTGVEGNFYTIDNTKVVANSYANYLRDAGGTPQTYYNNNGIANNNPSCGTGNLCTTTYSGYVYKLNSNANKTGLGITLKVMAGDRLDVFGKSYYFQNNPGSSNNNPVPILDILNGLLGSPTSSSTTVHGAITGNDINTSTGTAGITSMMTAQTTQNNANTNAPRAFINVIFFDEQFKAVDYRISMVGNNSEVHPHTELQNLTVPKNGFVYIYCSNETPVDVFFDNLQVVHTRGAILEETHYYPFGLTMAGISSKAAGSLENKKKYNGIELDNDFDLNTYEAFYRDLDPQTGRWWEIDPKIEHDQEDMSPYTSMANDPILKSDPLGDEPDPPSKGFWSGLKDGFLGTLSSAKNAVLHPIETGKAILQNIADHPLEFAANRMTMGFYGRAKQLYNDTKENGFGYAVGRMGGQNTAEATIAVTTAGAFKGTGALLKKTITSEVPAPIVTSVETTTQNANKIAEGLPDHANVVRGGLNTADRFTNGSGVTTAQDGTLNGVSVNSASGKSIVELSVNIPNKQIGTTTVGLIRQAGGDVVPSPTNGNPFHSTLYGIDAKTAEKLFTPTTQNPNH
ncbi:MAG: hypothetical protein JST86_11620 [Bacteroidetes bacterium]|nr:hypothetical protein [Bacteroidota bacterium]